ncbi:hypothetical protein SAMN05421770_101181 [Granulicella rosea]|uniref:Uncharacterized protein n=1 Tax=Granulicella rosea TaxID=474952 RepID=A0A239CYG3_9BACT|nr:hypothetical protein [Granulicella rosea]SNS24979.1 hypothetical protein SAMN05421770_101181 [Granulicella rosea]
MEDGKKMAIGLGVVGILALGIRFGLLYKDRHEADKPAPVVASAPINPDYNVFLKKERPDSLKDAKSLKGRTLWVSAGGQMNYYPFAAGKVDYAKDQGVLLGAEQLQIQDAVEQAAPKGSLATSRIPAGDKQVLLVFTKAGAPAEYAVPVGTKTGQDYTFSTDEIFFYDDPHILYKHWGPEVWKAIDEHRVMPGMTELECQMALGQVLKPGGGAEGDRSIEFDHQGKPIRVQFEHGKATTITPL